MGFTLPREEPERSPSIRSEGYRRRQGEHPLLLLLHLWLLFPWEMAGKSPDLEEPNSPRRLGSFFRSGRPSPGVAPPAPPQADNQGVSPTVGHRRPNPLLPFPTGRRKKRGRERVFPLSFSYYITLLLYYLFICCLVSFLLLDPGRSWP